MKKLALVAGALLALAGGGAAQAVTISDPVGDFLTTYTGPELADLDVTSFSVNFNDATDVFTLGATVAGPIDTNPATPGFYVIGINTGTGPIAPFGPVGQGNVRFNQFIVLQRTGAGTLSGPTGGPLTGTISGSSLSVAVALSALPSTGFAPEDYGFNLWPRVTGGLESLADFSPNNALLSVPEPATWATMLMGFGLLGGALRLRRRGAPVAASA